MAIAALACGMLEHSGLVAQYPFEGSAADESGGTYNGTVSGATLADGKFGRCYSFDGNDSVSLGTSIAQWTKTSPWTVAAWIKTSSAATQRIVANFDNSLSATKVMWQVSIATNATSKNMSVAANIIGGGVYRQRTAAPRLNDGAWHHIVAVNDGSNADTAFRFWIDGTESSAYANVGTGDPTTSGTGVEVLIGRRPDSGTPGYFIGDIDEVQLWSVALSPENVARVYCGMHPIQ